jgi:CHAT domain-containing protein
VALIESFYRAVSDGQQVGDALRAAKLAAMRRGASMRDWAAFTLVGDPTLRLALRRPG